MSKTAEAPGTSPRRISPTGFLRCQRLSLGRTPSCCKTPTCSRWAAPWHRRNCRPISMPPAAWFPVAPGFPSPPRWGRWTWGRARTTTPTAPTPPAPDPRTRSRRRLCGREQDRLRPVGDLHDRVVHPETRPGQPLAVLRLGVGVALVGVCQHLHREHLGERVATAQERHDGDPAAWRQGAADVPVKSPVALAVEGMGDSGAESEIEG